MFYFGPVFSFLLLMNVTDCQRHILAQINYLFFFLIPESCQVLLKDLNRELFCRWLSLHCGWGRGGGGKIVLLADS